MNFFSVAYRLTAYPYLQFGSMFLSYPFTRTSTHELLMSYRINMIVSQTVFFFTAEFCSYSSIQTQYETILRMILLAAVRNAMHFYNAVGKNKFTCESVQSKNKQINFVNFAFWNCILVCGEQTTLTLARQIKWIQSM